MPEEILNLKTSLFKSKNLNEIIPAFFGYLSTSGRLTDVNELALQVISSRSDEILGKYFWECPWWQSLPQSAERIHSAILDCARGESSTFDIEYCEIKANGEKNTRWVAFALKPILDEAGCVLRLAAMGNDITTRVIAQSRLKKMFETSPSFMALLSGPDFVIDQANESFFNLVGSSEILGKPLRQAIPKIASQEFIDLLMKVQFTGSPYQGKEIPLSFKTYSNSQEETKYLDFVLQPDESKPHDYRSIFIHGSDVTEKVLSKKALEGTKYAIENERENFLKLFTQIPEIVCILRGPNHIFEFVNDAHVRALGFNATGKTLREAQPESIEVHGVIDSVYFTGNTVNMTEIPVTLGHRRRYFNLTYLARQNTKGVVDGVMVLGAEITDHVLSRKSMISQKEILELTLRGTPVSEILTLIDKMIEEQLGAEVFSAIYLTSDDGSHLVLGAAISLPKSYKEVTGKIKIAEGSGNCGTSAFRNQTIIVPDIASDPLWSGFKSEALSHDLRACWSTPIRSSTNLVLGTIGVYFKHHRTPEARDFEVVELAASTCALVLERKSVELALQKAKIEAESANESKSRFLANISHEIRTPLAAILGFSDLLKEEMCDNNLAINDHLSRISKNAIQLGGLIDDLLDLSKIEAEHLVIESRKFDLISVIEDTIANLLFKAKSKDLEIRHSAADNVPKFIRADPLRFKQILFNLVGNSVKFTESGFIEVSLETLKNGKENFLIVRVSDTGIGIASENHKYLFERFGQADTSITRKYGGTGLGLTVSKHLAQLMGGDLILEKSEKGKGSIFKAWIRFEIEDENSEKSVEELEIKKPRKNSLELHNRKILIVDDAADLQLLSKSYIEMAGGIVKLANNGREGVNFMKNEVFDLVLMDLQMPVLDGYQALKEARSLGINYPIVALTAHAFNKEKEACALAGFDDYASKPINRSTLIDKLAKTIAENSDYKKKPKYLEQTLN